MFPNCRRGRRQVSDCDERAADRGDARQGVVREGAAAAQVRRLLHLLSQGGRLPRQVRHTYRGTQGYTASLYNNSLQCALEYADYSTCFRLPWWVRCFAAGFKHMKRYMFFKEPAPPAPTRRPAPTAVAEPALTIRVPSIAHSLLRRSAEIYSYVSSGVARSWVHQRLFKWMLAPPARCFLPRLQGR